MIVFRLSLKIVYCCRGGEVSESEGEEDEASQVMLPQRIASRGNIINSKSSIRVTEIGPRITMQVYTTSGECTLKTCLRSGHILSKLLVLTCVFAIRNLDNQAPPWTTPRAQTFKDPFIEYNLSMITRINCK
jgi:hypothetical protein